MNVSQQLYKTTALLAAALLLTFNIQAQTSTVNYVRTRVPRKAISTNAKLDALTPTKDSVMTTIQYVDGLGRPLQTVMQKASPSGYDIIQPIEYDAYGREAMRYLPYQTTNTSYGSYRSDALNTGAGVRVFYNPSGGATEGKQTNGVVLTPVPFAQTGFEASPLNRVVEQGAPGLAWQIPGTPGTGDANSGRNTLRSVVATNDQVTFSSSNITTNAGSRKVAYYTAPINANGSRSLLRTGNTATYPSNELYVTIIRDENWKPGDGCFGTIEEYKDKEGHIVLKRTYNLNTRTGKAEQISTYYVYDDLGNLCFVLPPGASPDNNTLISQGVIDLRCYQYRYDARNRLSQKKIPSKGWEYVIYNQLDQAIATQDSVQRMKAPQEWTVTKYDAMGRPVITGIYQHISSTAGVNNLAAVQALADTVTTYWETPVATGNGYTANAWPATVTTVLSVSYYDVYTGIPGLPVPYDQHTNTAYSQQTTGLLTATKTLVLNTTADYLWTVPYYDKEGKVIKSFSQHYLGGTSLLSQWNYDNVATVYNFTQQPISVVRTHFVTNAAKTGGVVYLTSTDTYTYDHMGRRRASYNQLRNGINTSQARVLVSLSSYNEIGQLVKKGLHAISGTTNFLQNVNYRYNPRGWLTNINNPTLLPDGGLTGSSTNDQFGMELKYDNTTTSRPQYNGNIATITTKTAPVSGTTYQPLTYDYRYDRVNRLNDAVSSTGAASKDGLHSEYLSYNTMGDITALGRYDNVLGNRTRIDTLAYSYSGYRQTRVDDSSSYAGPWGFTDLVRQANEYTYNGNGNMMKDLNKGITGISYNMLNLPQTITKSNGNSVACVYDASGRKLRKISVDVASGNTITTEYVDGIEYDSGTAAVTFIQTEEGRARKTGTAYKYEYDLRDHLSNTRLTTTWVPADSASQLTPLNLQHTEYYPFGYNIQSLQGTVPSPKNLYLYNHKELQEEIGLYDYGARVYDPVIGRWTTVDPLAAINRKYTPYNYANDNPIRNVDPDGMYSSDFKLTALTSVDLGPGGKVIKINQDGDPGVYLNKDGNRILVGFMDPNKKYAIGGTYQHYGKKDYYIKWPFFDFPWWTIIPRMYHSGDPNPDAGQNPDIEAFKRLSFDMAMIFLTDGFGEEMQGAEFIGPEMLPSKVGEEIIGWGTGPGGGTQTEALLEGLTKESVQAMKEKGLEKRWVVKYLKKYADASKVARKVNAANTNLQPRIAILQKILELWK
jgi:RHS repeat-associated protein